MITYWVTFCIYKYSCWRKICHSDSEDHFWRQLLPTGICLVVAGGLTQDLTLTLLLSTKNTEQNKTKKRKPKARIHLLQNKWRGIHCEEYMLCITARNNILENANREEDMLCVTTAELREELQDEDMLCFTASRTVKKI